MTDPESFNYYDSIPINTRLDHSRCMFGNSNIGNANLCNLHVPGIGSENVLIIQRWWARTNIGVVNETSGARGWMEQWSHHVQCVLQIDQTYKWRRTLADLFDRRPRSTTDAYEAHRCDPLPLLIQPRTNVQVQFDRFDQDSFDRLLTSVENHGPFGMSSATEPRDPLVWIHLEGIEIPTAVARTDMKKLADRILAVEHQHTTAEERIAEWLLGRMRDSDPHEMQYLSVVRDAILEGKHRG